MKRAAVRTFFLLALAVTVAGCDWILDPGMSVDVRTDGSTFVMDSVGVLVGFTVRNTGDELLYVDRCGPWLVTITERREGGGWVHHRGFVCPAVYLATPLELAPGQELEGSRSMHHAGRFRILVGVNTEKDWPFEWVASNGFLVEPDPSQ